MLKIALIALSLLITLGGVVAEHAGAQEYPSKEIRIVVGFPPSGTADIVARILAPRMSERLGVPLIIDNRPGASGTIGANAVAKAPPDGSTLGLINSGTASSAPHIMRLPYESDDIVPVAMLAKYSGVLVCHPSLPAKSVKELIALARARPGEITFASPGVGSGFHLGFELFLRTAEVRMTHVPYKGAAPAITDVAGGHVACTMNTLAPLDGLVKSGRIRPLAVTSDKRSAQLPGVPTLGEIFPGFSYILWSGIFVPKGTPGEIVARLNDEIVKILAEPSVAESWGRNGWTVPEPDEQTPKGFARLVAEESDRIGKLVRALGLKQ